MKAFERLWNFENLHAIFKQIEYLAFQLGCALSCYEWRRPHVLLLFVSSSNFSSTKLEDLPDDKNRSQRPPTNIVS